MAKEWKITLPLYKIVYGLLFIVILSIIRGVVFTFEIGMALEGPMALLAAVVCSDTYTREITSGRSELWQLYPMKKRLSAIGKRLILQEAFLFLLATLGYGFFFLFQHPMSLEQGAGFWQEFLQFLIYLLVMAVTLWFWGLLSHVLACRFRNPWAGLGGCLALWLFTNSTSGERYFGGWNLFSYSFREVENGGSADWVPGKILCLCACALLVWLIQKQLKHA